MYLQAYFVIALHHFYPVSCSALVAVLELCIANAKQFWLAGCTEGKSDSTDLPCPQGL